MFVEISRGRSFKGLAQYCLHDVGAKSAERVAFVETRNLATENPQLAWRIMAARHYLQDELKQKAGVGRGGAKDGKPVGHLLISWKREEAEAQQLNRLGMLNAANGALRAIGASQHQALVIGHTDTEHPHCHIIVNLIGDDGRLKKNWKEKEKLSKFALKQEIDVHGEPIVKTREKNWLDREAGETPAPVKKKARHLYELDKAAKRSPEAKRFADEHRQKLAELEKVKAAQRARHKRQQERLQWCLQERTRRLEAATEERSRASTTDVRKAYAQPWKELLSEQEAERREFERNEQNLKGSLANAMSLIDWKQLLRRKREPDQLRLSDAFHILTSEAVRRETLQKRQQTERDRLRSKQREEEQTAKLRIQEEQAEKNRQQRRDYVRKAAAMKDRHKRTRDRLKEQQQSLTKERNELLKALGEREQQQKLERVRVQKEHEPTKQAETAAETRPKEDFEHAFAEPAMETAPSGRAPRPRKERAPRQPRQPRERSRTRAVDILPQDENAGQVAKQIDDFEERMMRRMNERRREQERGRGDRER